MSDLVERGRVEREARAAEHARAVEANRETGKAEVVKAWVYDFYRDTLVEERVSYGRRSVPGDDTPTPEVTVIGDPGSLGGQWRYCAYEWEWEGIRWRAEPGQRFDFYVWGPVERDGGIRAAILHRLGRHEWREVARIADVAEALR